MSDSLFINPIKEQEVVQTSEMSTNAKIAAEAVASDGTEATEQNEAKTPSNSTELSKSEASVSLEKEMEVDQTSERAVEAASDEPEATEQEMDVDQTSKMASKAKMAAEAASEGTEATEQKIQQMQLAEDPHDLAMDELMEGTDDNEEQLKLSTVSGKAINKKASKSTELNKNEASGSREKVSEEAPANAIDIKNIVVKEEPIEYEL